MSLKVKKRGTKFRKAPTLTCVNIPLPPLHEEEHVPENPTSAMSLPSSNPLLSKKAPLHIFETDPARLELAKAQEAKRKRESAEMILALEKIQKRIEYTIREYEGLSSEQDPPSSSGEEVATGVNLEVVEDANQLFALLTDPTVRSKYHQKLTVFLIGYEEKKEALEGVLGQLRDFFLESQAGGTEELLQEVAGEEIDLDEATRDLDAALGKAQDSVRKLVGIKKEMSHLVSIVAAYPNTNKGRKQMEKSLLKAQEEVEVLSKSLEEVQDSLKQSSEKCSQLQVQLDVKTKDCTELRKTAEQAKLLQVGNEKLKGDLAKAERDLKESREELGKARSQLVTAQAEAQTKGSPADKERAAELERQLEEERARSQSLQAELEAVVRTHGEELEALKAEHEAESSEARGRFEEQLKSLMGEDMFGEQNDLEEGGESATEAMEGVDGDEVSLREVTPSPVEEVPGEACDELEDGSKAREVADSPADTEQRMEELKREWETREKKALEQVEDIKSKSRKMIALLQSQLTDANSKAASGREKLEAEVAGLKEELGRERDRNEELLQALAALRDEVASLEESLRQKGEELEEAQEELRAAITSQQEEMSFLRSQALSERPAMSPMQSLSTIPLRALEEEGGAAESSEDIEKSHVFPLSLEQSEVSVDPVPLGSPLRSQVLSGAGSYVGAPRSSPPLQPSSSPPAQCSLSMLAMSRLSHHSSLPQSQSLSHSHPVVVDWGKAYDSVIKFKENLVEMLSEHQIRIRQFPELIEELQNMELHSLDRKQDVQGQVTEMRFSLVLFLHQLEQTLQEGFSLMLAEITACEEEVAAAKKQSAEVYGAPGGGAEVTEQLKRIERRHREELERSKETIAHLSSQVESLRIQLGQLQNAVSSREERAEGTIMFTRLDSDRNTKALQSALEKEQLSAAKFSQLVEEMEDYLTLPTKRLVIMSRRWQEKSAATKLVQQIQQQRGACPDSRALRVVEGVAGLEEGRQREFRASMERIGEMRATLAHSLTTSLRLVEGETGKFLIKPVFTRSPPPPRCDLITPMPRPLPPPPAVAPSRRQSAKPGRRPDTSHTTTSSRVASSNVRLIQSFLQAHRQRADPQGLIQCVNSANSPTPHIRSSRQSRASLSGYHMTTPPHSSLPATAPEGDWDVGSSSVPQGEGQGVEPSISFSKMVELDISRHRQTDNLLGHVLPHMQPHNYTPLAASPTYHSRGHTPITGGMSRHLTPSPHKLRSLPEESSHSGSSTHSSQRPGSREVRVQEGWVRPQLPPIDVPSRTDTLTVM